MKVHAIAAIITSLHIIVEIPAGKRIFRINNKTVHTFIKVNISSNIFIVHIQNVYFVIIGLKNVIFLVFPGHTFARNK